MKRSYIAAISVVGLVGGWLANDLVEFVRVDHCLDGGGVWNYPREVCDLK